MERAQKLDGHETAVFCWSSLRPSGSAPGKGVPKHLDVHCDSHWASTRSGNARPLEREISEVIRATLRRRRNRWSRCPREWSGSSACRGIACRTGTGWLRHLEIRHMRTQERLQRSLWTRAHRLRTRTVVKNTTRVRSWNRRYAILLCHGRDKSCAVRRVDRKMWARTHGHQVR